jgi:hypothetical protein
VCATERKTAPREATVKHQGKGKKGTSTNDKREKVKEEAEDSEEAENEEAEAEADADEEEEDDDDDDDESEESEGDDRAVDKILCIRRKKKSSSGAKAKGEEGEEGVTSQGKQEDTSKESSSDEKKKKDGFGDSIEILVKWKDRAFIHSEWIDERTVLRLARIKYLNFLRSLVRTYIPLSLSLSLPGYCPTFLSLSCGVLFSSLLTKNRFGWI